MQKRDEFIILFSQSKQESVKNALVGKDPHSLINDLLAQVLTKEQATCFKEV